MSEFSRRFISTIILLPLTFILIIDGSIFFEIFILICFLISLYEWNKLSRNKLFIKFLGIIFLTFSFYTVLHLRIDFKNDYIYFFLVYLICVSTDIGGYIFGKIFKGPKLTHLSPKKTYSGMIGGFILAILAIIISQNILFNLGIFYSDTISYKLIIFGILVSFVSQVGDITISYFKRSSNLKDTGKLIPGHGGILDRIDGMIFAFPFSFVILNFEILDILK